jgi:hypothetical protein
MDEHDLLRQIRMFDEEELHMVMVVGITHPDTRLLIDLEVEYRESSTGDEALDSIK